jgi:signal transduction histidine kinase
MRRPHLRISRRGLVTLAIAGILVPTLVLALVGFDLVKHLFHFQNEILQDYSRFSVQYAADEIVRQVTDDERSIVSYLQLVSYTDSFVPEMELRRAELEYPLIDNAFLACGDGTVVFGRRAHVPSDSCMAATLAERGARAERIVYHVLDAGAVQHVLLSGDIHFYVGSDDGAPYQLVAFPARDANNMPRGVMGFLLNEDTVRREVVSHILDTTIHAAEDRFSPDFGRVLTFVVNDEAGREVYTHRHENEAGAAANGRRFLAQAPLNDLFPGWHVRITYTKASGFAWSKRVLTLQVAVLGIAALLAVLGTLFMVRFSLRQMELSRLKSHFVSNITHELKTPLAAIQLYTETLRQGRVRDRVESDRFLDIIHRETVRLGTLIHNILDFSRIEQGRRRYNFAPAPVGEVVRGVVDSYAYQVRDKGFDLSLDVADALPTMPLDRDALGQAVLNLLDNAVKYSGQDRRIEVSVQWPAGAAAAAGELPAPAGSELAIRVRDHGIGIPAPERSKIFEAFYRIEKGLLHDVKGSGLGLAVVKHVAEAHGGRVEVESRPGEGSTFTLWLPVREYVAPADAGTAEAGEPWQQQSA